MKRSWIAFLLFALLLSVFVGCADNGTTEDTSSIGESSDSEAVESEGTESSEAEESTDEPSTDSLFAEVVELKNGKMYCIDTAEQLFAFADVVNSQKYDFEGDVVLLRKDIELNPTDSIDDWVENPPEKVWTPIGSKAFPFKGSFVGGEVDKTLGYIQGNKSINGIYCPQSNSGAGLFGYIESAEIRYITLGKGLILGPEEGKFGDSAAFAVEAENSTLYVCRNYADVYGTSASGIVGTSCRTELRYCNNYGAVNGRDAGGIVSDNMGNTTIRGCLNKGEINATQFAGGILAQGSDYGASVIASCANHGDITSEHVAGGIVGFLWEEQSLMTVLDVINLGSVTVNTNIIVEEDSAGGIIGSVSAVTIEGLGDFYLKGAVNLGKVGGNVQCGAITGNEPKKADPTQYVDCYYLDTTVSSSVIGRAVAESELDSEKTFKSLINNCDWWIDEALGHIYIVHYFE